MTSLTKELLFGRKAIILVLLAVSFMLVTALFMYGPLSKVQLDAPNKRTYFSYKANETWDCKTALKSIRSPLIKRTNFRELVISEDMKFNALAITVETRTVNVGDMLVYYRTGISSKLKKDVLPVVLLHGKAFSSKTWEELGTIRLITAFGFRAIAIDLPDADVRKSINKLDFFQKLMNALEVKKPVIVSPSMSGTFSLPYIIANWANVSGFVPIAPLGTIMLKDANCGGSKQYHLDATCYSWTKRLKENDIPDLSCIKVPVLVICGEHDDILSSSRLCHLPWSKGVEIPDGNHAAYMTNPDLWHQILYNFLFRVNKASFCS